jgi:ATP-dependent helicase/nuclease subunit A
VLASAGTGKTHELSSRFIRLIAQGADPATILATTFTRKAAGEILQRILRRLADAAESTTALQVLRESVPGLTQGACEELTAKLAGKLHRLNIGTIDSFFARMLRGFALDLEAPPSWTIIDDVPDRELRSLAVTRALECPDREAGASRLVTLVRMLFDGGFGRPVHERIVACVDSAYAAYLSTREYSKAWEVFRPVGPAPTVADLASLAEALEAARLPLTQKGDTDRRWSGAVQNLADRVRAADWKSIFDGALVTSMLEGGQMTFARVEIPPALQELIRRVIESARRALLSRLRDRNIATRDLLADFDAAYSVLKARRGVMRFDDVPRLLLDAHAQSRTQEMYYRLDARIKHLLLDEFQDTSLDQFAILEPMLSELVSSDEGSVFCVGDVKQSLYSWRGAEPRLLPALGERWPQLTRRTLEVNRRSSPAIIDTVNKVFGLLTTNPALSESGAADPWSTMFTRHIAKDTEQAGVAQLVVAATVDEEEDETNPFIHARIDFIARHTKDIAQEAPNASLAILTRANTLIPRLLFELRRQGLIAVGEHGNPLTDSPGAAVAISALHLAEHPGDSAAYFHIATSPLGASWGLNWTPESAPARTRLAARLRARVARDGLHGFLRRLQRRMASSMDEYGFSRFDQLIDLAEDFDAGAADFARFARERPVEPVAGAGHAIRVMTIHKAKGLEFDAVILPELDTPWNRPRGDVLLDRLDHEGNRDPLSRVKVATTNPGEACRLVDPELEELFEHHRTRLHVEELCLLYVAMTRARRRLDMLVFPRKRGGRLSAQRVLCEALAPGNVLEKPGIIWREPRTQSGRAWFDGIELRSSALEGEELRVNLAPVRTRPAGRLGRTSPSALEGGDRVNLADLWRPPAARGEVDPRDRGTAFHAMFEAIQWLDDGKPPAKDVFAPALLGLEVSLSVAEALVEEFQSCIRGEVAGLFSPSRYSDRAETITLRREWTFAVREPDGHGTGEHILTGSIDRVVIGFNAGRPAWAEVIDFKTDEVSDDAAMSASIEHYRPQLDAYRRAVSAMLRLPVESVSACLAYTCGCRVVSL